MTSGAGRWLIVWRTASGWHTAETEHDEVALEMEEGIREEPGATHVAVLHAPDYEIREDEP